jgi:hypothetical protein
VVTAFRRRRLPLTRRPLHPSPGQPRRKPAHPLARSLSETATRSPSLPAGPHAALVRTPQRV